MLTNYTDPKSGIVYYEHAVGRLTPVAGLSNPTDIADCGNAIESRSTVTIGGKPHDFSGVTSTSGIKGTSALGPNPLSKIPTPYIPNEGKKNPESSIGFGSLLNVDEEKEETILFPSDVQRGLHIRLFKIVVENKGQPSSGTSAATNSGTKTGVGSSIATSKTNNSLSGVVGSSVGLLGTGSKMIIDTVNNLLTPITTSVGYNTESIKKESFSTIDTMTSQFGMNHKEKDLADIYLPMPVDVSVRYSAGWEANSLSALEYALRESIRGNDGEKFIGQAIGLKTLEGVSGLASLGGSGANILRGAAKASGIAFNPYRELMYDAPGFRTFSFSWVLSPNNPQDMRSIESIIWRLKKHMHPRTMNGKLEETVTWGYPDYVEMRFIGADNGTNLHLFKIEKSVITNINVSYDTKFRVDDSPAVLSLTVDITETILHSQDSFSTNFDGSLSI